VLKYPSQAKGRVFCGRACSAVAQKLAAAERRDELRAQTVKTCFKCGKTLDVCQFAKNRAHADGLAGYCKVCDTARQRARDIRLRTAHIDKFLRALHRMSARRARLRGLSFSITVDDLLDLWHNQAGVCAISGMLMTHIRGKGRIASNVSIDRVNSSFGYTRENIQLVCLVVNFMKNKFSLSELKFWADAILRHQSKTSGGLNENPSMAA
jgi:hypothetical protein